MKFTKAEVNAVIAKTADKIARRPNYDGRTPRADEILYYEVLRLRELLEKKK